MSGYSQQLQFLPVYDDYLSVFRFCEVAFLFRNIFSKAQIYFFHILKSLPLAMLCEVTYS